MNVCESIELGTETVLRMATEMLQVDVFKKCTVTKIE